MTVGVGGPALARGGGRGLPEVDRVCERVRYLNKNLMATTRA
jgi:hypothetical protein